jgi:hypothetical protein
MDWLYSVNKNLVTTGCTDAEKVKFAAHLLEGPAASWWDTYQITHLIEGVTWDSFQEGFWAAHISYGLMGLKKKEFRDLRHKCHSVSEYIDEFTNLSHYAPNDIDTDAKRKDKFLEGLNDELSIPLSVAYTPTFQSLLDQAITLESKMKQSENRKMKHHVSKYQQPVHKRSFHSGSGVLDSIRMEGITTTIMVEMGIITTREMATTIMATGVNPFTTLPGQMATTMATMAETTMFPRRGILVKWNAIRATRLGIMQMIAHRRRMKETSLIHSRRDMLIMSMWRRFMMSLMLSMVRFSLMTFQHLFFLILVHLIHSSRGYLWIEIKYQPEP